MKPYYQHGGITIYHGDCKEMTLCPDVIGAMTAADYYESCSTAKNGVTHVHSTADIQVTDGPVEIVEIALITDPPYGTKLYPSDQSVLTEGMLREWVARFETVGIFGWPENLVALCVSGGVIPSEWITWWPTNAVMRGFNLHGLWREAETVAIFGSHQMETLRRPRSEFASWFQIWHKASKASGHRVLRAKTDQARCGDVWRDTSPHLGFTSNQRNHPNEKPIALMLRLLSGIRANLIIDPFAGSGPTLLAAKILGRRAVGIEIEERYCEIAAKRLGQEVLPFLEPSEAEADEPESATLW